MRIMVSGSLAYDRIMDFPGKFEDHILPEKIHILNVCFTVNGLVEKFGGTAGNIAYNLALLGERPVIIATAGEDFDRYEQWLQTLGLPLEGIRRIEGELTAGAYITTDLLDNQITGFNPGAMKFRAEFQVDGSCNPEETLAIVAPGNLEDMAAYSKAYKEGGIPYIFDPGQSITALSGKQLRQMISGSEVLISNDYELEMITKRTGLEMTELLARTKAVVTTLGEQGSVVHTPEGREEVKAARAARVVDPTGAGDAYRAGLIKGLVMRHELITAARIGATCASYAVECHGTQEHSFSEEDFWGRYRANFGAE
ncbi:MAG: carbohydrate kinase family protein, partial [Deltaproteobacteria bacterium]|nr:carbohydrate kinase family protein [Deltaproteobacteria bacterium]